MAVFYDQIVFTACQADNHTFEMTYAHFWTRCQTGLGRRENSCAGATRVGLESQINACDAPTSRSVAADRDAKCTTSLQPVAKFYQEDYDNRVISRRYLRGDPGKRTRASTNLASTSNASASMFIALQWEGLYARH